MFSPVSLIPADTNKILSASSLIVTEPLIRSHSFPDSKDIFLSAISYIFFSEVRVVAFLSESPSIGVLGFRKSKNNWVVVYGRKNKKQFLVLKKRYIMYYISGVLFVIYWFLVFECRLVKSTWLHQYLTRLQYNLNRNYLSICEPNRWSQ